ncbi:hypothetical protein KC363_g8612 [Hortaea werneckii]|nr:hypothetical protein KC325_g8709 [Hortaea werneckii]KAI6986193.1 hypothetical protein KC359_g8848 [Hortaea werneckii]KAI7140429.1 hypothetical protein KC344_g8720 [Hortaea werneckii]KAI7167323.1 hypothetical protein KC360_g8716 [Hortaea werneckii]KAI7182728.1 hypothetical protein KC363_g8612 [Hortaea werneckii]
MSMNSTMSGTGTAAPSFTNTAGPINPTRSSSTSANSTMVGTGTGSSSMPASTSSSSMSTSSSSQASTSSSMSPSSSTQASTSSSMSPSSSSQASTSSSMSPSSSTQASTSSSASASSSTVTIATPITPTVSRDPTSTASSTSVTSTVPPGFTPSPSPVSAYADRVLLAHNVHRANHSAADLTYSNELAAVAQEIASSCVYAHDTTVESTTGNGVYGQNIAAGLTADEVTDVITNLWYNNEVTAYAPYYGQANPGGNFADYGHFTQIVWQGTTVVGCATQDCSAGGLANVGPNVPPYFTVCNYYEAGNYGGEYADNIDPPLGFPTVTGDYGVADSVNV